MSQNILCIDDNKDTCDLLMFVFQRAGYKIISTGFAEEGIRLARENHFAAIILDYRLGDLDGIDLCRIIRTFDTETPIIFFTAEAREATKQRAIEAGAQVYLVKPDDFEDIDQTVIELIKEEEFSFVASKNYRLNSVVSFN